MAEENKDGLSSDKLERLEKVLGVKIQVSDHEGYLAWVQHDLDLEEPCLNEKIAAALKLMDRRVTWKSDALVATFHGELATELNKLMSREKGPRLSSRRFFRFVEISARLLPTKVRIQSFEPAYHDEKAAFLKDRSRYKSKAARRWLAFCFALHVATMVAQCGWGMLGDKLRRLLLAFLPDAFRKLFGG